MRRMANRATVLTFLGAVVTANPRVAQEGSPAELEAIATIHRLGGSITVAETGPAVVGIRLNGRNVSNADVLKLEAFRSLRDADPSMTSATDAG